MRVMEVAWIAVSYYRHYLHIESRLQDDNLVSFIEQGLHGSKQGLGSTHSDGDLLQRINGTLDQLAVVASQGVHKRQVSQTARVLIGIRVNGL